jgi:carbonic anhydrase
MEIHLVHQDATGHILVVGVFVEYGETNPAVGTWWDHMPQQPGETTMAGLINAKDLLPAAHHHYTYHGSLTTPPCSEGVQWVILRTPVTLSYKQMRIFTQIIGNNARSIQVLYDREIDEE